VKTGEHDIDLVLDVFADDDPPGPYDIETIRIVKFTKDYGACRYFLGNQKLGELRTSHLVQILAEGDASQKFRNKLHEIVLKQSAMLAVAARKYKVICARFRE
jgi:hypothetical protein